MGKFSKGMSFKNATIDLSDMTITEVTKDEELTFDLNSILNEWNGVEGVSISIKKDSDIKPISK